MNIRQLTTKLQEDCNTHKIVEYRNYEVDYTSTKENLDKLIQNTINQILAYVSEEVEGMKKNETRPCTPEDMTTSDHYDQALTDIQKILEVKE